MLRKLLIIQLRKDAIGFYVASLSYKTVIYKGQLTSLQVRNYFPDLSNKKIVSVPLA